MTGHNFALNDMMAGAPVAAALSISHTGSNLNSMSVVTVPDLVGNTYVARDGSGF